MLELNNVHQGDCIELMKQIPDNSIDAIITDPPYGISSEMKITRTRNTMKFKANTDISGNFGEWDKFENIDKFMAFTYNWIDIADSKLRTGGMFISYFNRDKINFLSHYLQNKRYKCKGYYADCKQNPVPQARKVKWMNGWEICGMWQKSEGKLTFNYHLGQHKDYGLRPIVAGKERTIHPTQKPMKVIEDFIRYFTNQNDVVLDPFLGSGTTAVACEKLNRRWIGIEKEQEYVDISNKRLEKYKGQRRLL